MEIIGGLLAGAFIGAVLGFIGAGGAMLSVPILLYIFGFSAIPATTGALAIVLSASLAGALPKARAKEILYRDAIVIWSLGLVTNLAAFLTAIVNGARFKVTTFVVLTPKLALRDPEIV
ncbi:MAG: hypothetical protein RIR15_544 [Actinomycetota bacterium]